MAKKILFTFIAFIAIIGIFLTLYGWSASRSWQKYLSELRAAGEPLTFAEIQSKRSPIIGDDLTIADVVARVAVDVKKSPGPISRGVLGMSNNLQINFFKGIPRDAIETTRKYMAPRRLAFADIETIHNLEPGRFNINYNIPAQDLITRFAIKCPPIRRLSKILYLDATLKLIDGDIEAAAATIPKLFDVVLPLAEEPAILAHLYRMATAASAIHILENSLRVGTLSDKTLKKIDDTLAKYLKSHSMKWALWSERVLLNTMLDRVRSAIRIPGASLFVGTYGNQQRMAEMYGWLIKAGDDPIKLLAARNKVDFELSTLSKTLGLTSLFPPATRSITLHLRCLAEIQAARIAIAAERFRLSTGEFPTTLDQLVPEFLQEIPVDPFDQTFMKLLKRDDGLVIYSSSVDGIDDSGHVVPDEGEKRSRDCGFRLLGESSRGLVLIETQDDDGG